MVRDYEDRPLPAGALDRLLADAGRGPSAGFTQGSAFIALEGREQTEMFWSHTFAGDEARAAFTHQGLFRAPAIVIPLACKEAYLARYALPDKAATPLDDEAVWPVPYWDVDAGFATMLLLLSVVDAGLGALFFGIFGGEAQLLSTLGVPPAYLPIGAVAIGYPAEAERSPASGRRRRRPLEELVHKGHW